MKKILTILLLVLSALTLVSCQNNSGTKKKADINSDADLKITFFNGGYGEDWINNLAKRFEEANNVKVEVVSSNEGNCGAENYIKTGYNLSDIYFGENIPWKSLLQGGYLADLTDVYEAEVETRNGKVKIKDFLDDSSKIYFYAQRQLKTPEYFPWAMPWTVQPNAMAYNEDILKEIKHVSEKTVTAGCIGEDDKWVLPPATMDDLYAFCEDCIAFNNNSAEKQALNDTHNYYPIGWAGADNIDSIGFFIITWWAELQGLTTSNYENEGTFYDFFNFGNTVESNANQTVTLNVYRQTGLSQAYDTFAKLFFDESGNYKNTLPEPLLNNAQDLQRLFVASASTVVNKPVLAIASSYLENEVVKNRYIDSDKDGKQDITFKFMNVPKINAESEDILWGRLSDCAVIPSNSPHIDLAKKFLIFMSSEEEIDNFAKDTNGGLRPFKCDVRTSVTGIEYSDFANSLFDVYYNSELFLEFPKNSVSEKQVSHVYRYSDPKYYGNLGWLDILNTMKNPGQGKNPGNVICNAVISRLRQTEYDNWIRIYKLKEVQ